MPANVTSTQGSSNNGDETIRQRLLSKREELVNDLAKNREVTEETVDESAQDMVDRATSAYTREFAYTLSETDIKMLTLIDEALERLGHGAYGTCLNCSQPLEEKRLEAVPWARFCLDCQELQDRGML
jgi:DnaK suppressor protein